MVFESKEAEQTVRDAASSPPLTSSLHSRNSASSVQESAYLRQASILRWARLVLSILNSGIAIAVVGCTGHVLHSYIQTNLGPEWFLSLWPVNVDLKPTLGTMISAAVVTTMSLTYVLFAVMPSPRARTFFQVLLFLFTSTLAFTTTLFSVLFSQLLTYHFDVDTRDSLQTWTCKFYNGAKQFERDAKTLQINVGGDALIPTGFTRLCMESMAGQWMTIGMLVVELICFGIAIWGLVTEMKIRKSRQMKYKDEKSEGDFE